MTRRARRFVIVVVAALHGAWPAEVRAQAQQRVAFVSVVASDSKAPVTELTPGDFVIREDGVPREVLRMTPATGAMPIALLVDNSAAAERSIPDIRTAVTRFVDALGDVGPVSIVTLGERPTVVTDYASSRDALMAGVGRLFSRPDSGATVLDAVVEVSRGLQKRESERAAMVILSVNGVEQSLMLAARAQEHVKRAGATLHVVTFVPPGQAAFDDAARQRDLFFDRGVRETGGSSRNVLTSISLPGALTDVARILSHQYRVVYARPRTLIPPESFSVAAAKPGFTAHGTAARGQQP